MNQFQQEIYKTIDILTDEKMARLGFDRTKRGKVVSIDATTCIVEINGENYTCKMSKGVVIEPNDIVYVKFPQNNETDKYVETALGESILPETTLITAEEILTKLKLVDGIGSGLNADLLDGKHGSEYATQEDLAGMEVDISGEIIVGNINSTISKIMDKNLSLEANDAIDKKHTHSNKAILDGVGQVDIDTWNEVIDKANVTYVDNGLGNKVDKAVGKQLSTEDYSTIEKNKLSGVETGAQVNTVISVAGKTGVVSIEKGDISLNNVENKSSAMIRSEITNSNVINGLGFIPEKNTNKGIANGYAPLDSNSKIPLSVLPDTAKQQTYIVQDLSERDSLTDLIIGEKSYVLSTSDSYIWDGMYWQILAKANWENINLQWVNINGKPQSSTEDIDNAVNDKHTHTNKSLLDSITQTLVERWNSAWEHITDGIKHITGAERTLWNTVSNKETVFTKKTAFNKDFGTTSGTVAQGNDSRLSDARTPTSHTHTPAEVSLGNVDNTTDANKPVSTATQTVLDLKADKTQVLTNVPSGALFTDTITTINGKTGAIAKEDIEALGISSDDPSAIIRNNDAGDGIVPVVPLDADLLGGESKSYFATDVKVGVLSSLATSIKTSVVNAINSLKSEVDSNKNDLVSHKAESVSQAGGVHGLIYETGIFTATLKFGGNNVGLTADRTTGKYTRIGNSVSFGLEIRLTNKGTSIGAVTIEGLPFIPASRPPTMYTVNVFFTNTNLDLTATEKTIKARIVETLPTIYINTENTNAGFGSFDSARLANNSSIIVSGEYKI